MFMLRVEFLHRKIDPAVVCPYIHVRSHDCVTYWTQIAGCFHPEVHPKYGNVIGQETWRGKLNSRISSKKEIHPLLDINTVTSLQGIIITFVNRLVFFGINFKVTPGEGSSNPLINILLV